MLSVGPIHVLAGLALLLASPAGAGAGAEADLCRAEVALSPTRAVVGQQVVYQLHILRRRDVSAVRWERNLSFPAFRVEWLPGSVAGDAPGPDGESYQLFEERRALFPARAGRLVIPPASLICRGPEGDAVVEIPGASLLVAPEPEAGRPPGWSGVVGPIRLRTGVSPMRIAVGESARVRVLIEGPANVWDARLDLAEAIASEHLEVFAREEETSRDAGRLLRLRRYQVFDLVPRREGMVRVPALAVAWLDPETGAYAWARSEPLVLAVDPAPPAPPAPQQAAAALRDPEPAASELGSWPAVAAGLALAALAAAAVARRRARRTRDEPVAGIGGALAEAARAEEAGDVDAAAGALARAVRLELGLPGAQSRSTEELFAAIRDDEDRALVLLLQRLDRARFAREGSLAEVRSVREALARRVGP